MNSSNIQPSKIVNESGGISAADARRLVARAKDGDEDAFGELVKANHQRIQSVIHGLVNNADDAKEVAQQTWCKAWKKLSGYKEDAQFFTWVYRIAANTALDFLRHKARLREEAHPEGLDAFAETRDGRAPSENPRPDLDAQRSEVRRLFEEALDTLSPEHRLVLVLREVEGLSYDEIADATGCRKGTVMSRLFYARRQMQEKLRELQ